MKKSMSRFLGIELVNANAAKLINVVNLKASFHKIILLYEEYLALPSHTINCTFTQSLNFS